ncbi:hypothetical protein FALBO_14058 [Fusarium albosuccineum]|uniref:Uncharacterized protein n=1 Tax=Fusarium albosuccineum TaxID=1237068 RepID=A0A8H4PFX1_9HYPO|nr:hypothetical protein FALBO_14058 [Fusarium albosuccineum]
MEDNDIDEAMSALEIPVEERVWSPCTLCRFGFEDGETIVRVTLVRDGELVRRDPFAMTYRTPPFDPDHPEIWDESRPSFDNGWHHDCFYGLDPELIRRTSSVIPYSRHLPQPSAETERISWLLRKRTHLLTRCLPLPREICSWIARYGIREQAQLEAKKLLSAPFTGEDIVDTIDTSGSIWAHFLEIEGVQYIQSLKTEPIDDSDVLIRTPDAQRVENIYDIRIHDVASPEHPRFILEAWSSIPPSLLQRFELSGYPRGNSRMRSFDCNNPRINGYSACFIEDYPVSLHYHVTREDFAFDMVDDDRRLHAMWLYMPVEPDERVAEIWRRRWNRDACNTALMLRTSKGRVLALGARPQAALATTIYDLLAKFQRSGPRRLYWGAPGGRVGKGIDYLAVESVVESHTKERLRTSSYPPDGRWFSFPWNTRPRRFYTSAKLGNVVEVARCRSWAPGSSGIVGLVFVYSDGRRESVGQVRLDHLEPPARVDPVGGMVLGLKKGDPDGFTVETMRVVSLSDTTPADGVSSGGSALQYLRVSWRGQLDWWFWYGRNWVYYQEDGATQDELREAHALYGLENWEEHIVE